jgi:hypothetical protein
MLWMVHSAWRYRKEILLGIGVVSELRKTARDFTRDYIRRRVKQGLVTGIALILFQVVLLLGALLFVAVRPSLLSRLVASSLLWAITLYNLTRFFTATIPELRAVRKTLKSKIGYTLKYVLRISLATELMQWNLILPLICLAIAALTRSAIGTNVSFFAPWVQAFHQLSHAR